MRYLLNTAYFLLLIIASPWLLVAACRHGKYRAGLSQKLWGQVARLDAHPQRVWFHAVSVGEVNLLDPILDRLRRDCPNVDIVISTTTRTGQELARKKFSRHTVVYCPLDFTWAVGNAFARINPHLFVLVELELWPNLLLEAERRNIPVAVINGRLSDESFAGYQRFGLFFRRWVRSIAAVTAQSRTCAERFVALGVASDRVHDVGSVKFDGATTERANPRTRQLAAAAQISDDELVFLAGSTQAPEELYAARTFARWRHEFPNLRLILVPRHPERFEEVARMLSDMGLPWSRRSELDGDAAVARVLLVDVIGELAAWWGRADIGFVGGSIGKRGGQNMIEPAAYGVATSFGPNTQNFRDVVGLLLARGAAVVVANEAELAEFVRHCAADADYRHDLSSRAVETVLRQTGAADRTVAMLKTLLADVAIRKRRVDAVARLGDRRLRRTA